MNIFRWLFFSAILALLLIWWFFFRVGIDTDSSKIYRALIIKKTNSSPLSIFSAEKIISSWILFYHYPVGNFFLFEIDEATSTQINDDFIPIHNSRKYLKEKIAEYYGVEDFDFEIHFTENQQLDFLKHYGGNHFFNLYSSTIPLGEIYINDLNYLNFLEGIGNLYHRKITALGFWFNLLMSFQESLPHWSYTKNFIKNFHHLFSGNLNYPTFWALVKPLLFTKENEPILIREKIQFQFGKNNIENISEKKQIFLPYLNGDYDREKILKILKEMEKEVKPFNNQSISTQIKNATAVKRLAARAAGFFRLRGINIIEYLGFSTLLKHSVILDFSNDPLKREYIKKITRINRIYHLFNYREDYDFAIYLGEDFYVLQNQNRESSTD